GVGDGGALDERGLEQILRRALTVTGDDPLLGVVRPAALAADVGCAVEIQQAVLDGGIGGAVALNGRHQALRSGGSVGRRTLTRARTRAGRRLREARLPAGTVLLLGLLLRVLLGRVGRLQTVRVDHARVDDGRY